MGKWILFVGRKAGCPKESVQSASSRSVAQRILQSQRPSCYHHAGF